MELTISFSTILMACLSFLGVYILMPLALIARDFLIVKLLLKFILTKEFWSKVKIAETDRAYLVAKYNLSSSVSYDPNTGEASGFMIGEKTVTANEYAEYIRQQDFHGNRMRSIGEEVAPNYDFIMRTFKYFKLEGYGDDFKKRINDVFEASLKDIQSQGVKKEQSAS